MSRPMSSFNTPERSTTPPEQKYITADCGHEVYEGETYVYWKNAKGQVISLCPDCFWDRIKELTIQEAATIFNCDYKEVTA